MNILNYNKAEGLSWLGHVHRIIRDKMVKNYTIGKPISTRSTGRLKIRRENDMKEYLKIM